MDSGRVVSTYKAHSGSIYGLALSPDGRRLVSSGSDQTVKIWDIATAQELQTLSTNAGYLTAVAFSPDGHQIAAIGSLQRLVLWDARPLTNELRLETAAGNLVAALIDRQWLKHDVIAILEDDKQVSDPVLHRALELARQYSESPSRLNDLSWSVVSKPLQNAEQYALGLRAAERAVELSTNGLFQNTLGVAQYRNGKYSEALVTLTQSAELNRTAFGGFLPADIAFLSMTLHHLGRADEATRRLDELRETLANDPWKSQAESQAFLNEANALISPRAEATTPPSSAVPP